MLRKLHNEFCKKRVFQKLNQIEADQFNAFQRDTLLFYP